MSMPRRVSGCGPEQWEEPEGPSASTTFRHLSKSSSPSFRHASALRTVTSPVPEVRLTHNYGYATEYKKSVHAKCFLNSWYFRGYGPGYGMLFRLFSAIRRYS